MAYVTTSDVSSFGLMFKHAAKCFFTGYRLAILGLAIIFSFFLPVFAGILILVLLGISIFTARSKISNLALAIDSDVTRQLGELKSINSEAYSIFDTLEGRIETASFSYIEANDLFENQRVINFWELITESIEQLNLYYESLDKIEECRTNLERQSSMFPTLSYHEIKGDNLQQLRRRLSSYAPEYTLMGTEFPNPENLPQNIFELQEKALGVARYEDAYARFTDELRQERRHQETIAQQQQQHEETTRLQEQLAAEQRATASQLINIQAKQAQYAEEQARAAKRTAKATETMKDIEVEKERDRKRRR